MIRRSRLGRQLGDYVLKVLAWSAALVGVFFLLWILFVVISHGAAAFSWSFFTELPAPPGVGGGGLANAMLGTLYMTLLASLAGVPVGMMVGVYLSEFALGSRFGNGVRFAINVLMGFPSIIMGLFAYSLLVVPMGHFSGYAGGLSLALLMLPVVARTAEDMLLLVPNALRESALALGAPRWRVTLGIVFRAAKGGLLTGILLGVARVSGETAPLLFTALNSPYWVDSLNQPTANLTVTIFNYAMSPYPDWQQAAWGASFLIAISVLSLTILTRVVARDHRR